MGNNSRYYVRVLSRISFIYDKGGYGVEEDNAEAIKWYSKAVGTDKSKALALRLADMYFDGEGVDKDPRMAVNLLYQSEYEDRNVCRRLARCYIDGEGVPENMFMAAIWWLKAGRLNWILVFAGLTGIIAIGSIMIVSICFVIIYIKKIFS
jgi:TPR repeat protein